MLWIGYSGRSDRVNSEVLRRLRDKKLVEFCSAISDDGQESNPALLDEILASEFDAMFARYKFSVFNPLGLIDNEMSALFSSFEGETLRMMDRLHDRGPAYRFRDSFDKRRRMFLDHCSFWNEYLQARQISHIIFASIPHQVFDFVLYQIAQKLSISIIIFSPEKAGKSRKFEQIKWVKRHETSVNRSLFFLSKNLDDIGRWDLSTQIKTYAESHNINFHHGEFLSEDIWVDNTVEMPQVVKSKRSTAIISIYKSFMRAPKYPHEIVRFFRNSLISYRQFSRHLRKSNGLLSGKKYLLYSMAYHPEESTAPRAGIFVEQQLAIRALSRLVPDGWHIRVREHPDQYGRRRPRPGDYWDEIERLPNVEIVPINESVSESITKAEAIASPTGTICVEAWLRGLPVLLFGSMFLRTAPGVFSISTILDLRNAIAVLLTGSKIDLQAKRDFCSWTNSHSYIGSILTIHHNDKHLRAPSVNNIEGVLTSWLSLG